MSSTPRHATQTLPSRRKTPLSAALAAAFAVAVPTITLAAGGPLAAQVCPFDNGGSSLAVDGLILARYAQGVTGAPLVANTGIPAASAGTVADSITSEAYDLRITGNAAMTPVDSLIISRKLAGMSGSALTDGLNLGSGSRSTPAAVQSFLLAGCAGSAWVKGGNAFGVPGIIGTTDSQSLTVQSGGAAANLFVAGGNGLRVQISGITSLNAPNVINGSVANQVTSGARGATIAGGGANLDDPFYVGASGNSVTDAYGTVGGGHSNRAGTLTGAPLTSTSSTVAGGDNNVAEGFASAVTGGSQNKASGVLAVVGGGLSNQATGLHSAVFGGQGNLASGEKAFVGGGISNQALGEVSSVLGGTTNVASGAASSVLGGLGNSAQGITAVASGYYAQAIHNGSFVWADVGSNGFASTTANQFNVRATGGARFVTATDGAGTPTRTVSINNNGTLDFGSVTRQNINLWGGGTYGIGVQSGTQYFRTDANAPIGVTSGFSWHLGGVHDNAANAPGAGGTELMRLSTIGNLYAKGNIYALAVLNTSDRNVKSLIQSINPQAILAKVAAMPISRWVYNADEKKSWHLGPMAQDFRAAFGLGQDDKTIATVDAGGVALAAIQGLHTLVKTKDAKIVALEKANALMQKKLAAIEKRLGL
jgi:trimeric autotransporter adhesin